MDEIFRILSFVSFLGILTSFILIILNKLKYIKLLKISITKMLIVCVSIFIITRILGIYFPQKSSNQILSNLLKVLYYIKTSQFIKSCILEAFKGLVAFLFGYLGFNLYEGYKNKKDNNKVYAQFLKLDREMMHNIELIDNGLNEYVKLATLKKKFYINNKFSDELLDLYKSVCELNMYEDESPVYDTNGEMRDYITTYERHPYYYINDLADETANLLQESQYNSDEIEGLTFRIDELKKKDIFEDLKVLQSKAEKLTLIPEIQFLHEKLTKFNNLSKEDKTKYLTTFCEIILKRKNIFTNSLNEYKAMVALEQKLDSNIKVPKLDIKFNLWQEIDIDLLVVYNAELYLQLEELYTKINNLEVYINKKDTLYEAKKVIVSEIKPLIDTNKEHLKNILQKTNKLFKNI